MKHLPTIYHVCSIILQSQLYMACVAFLNHPRQVSSPLSPGRQKLSEVYVTKLPKFFNVRTKYIRLLIIQLLSFLLYCELEISC